MRKLGSRRRRRRLRRRQGPPRRRRGRRRRVEELQLAGDEQVAEDHVQDGPQVGADLVARGQRGGVGDPGTTNRLCVCFPERTNGGVRN